MRHLITYFRSRSNQVFPDFGLEIPDLAHHPRETNSGGHGRLRILHSNQKTLAEFTPRDKFPSKSVLTSAVLNSPWGFKQG